MSKKLIECFLPSITGIVKTIIPRTYSAVLPDDIAVLCPEPTIVLSSPTIINNGKATSILIIRNPVLLVAAILGVVIGVFGGIRFAKKKGQIWSQSFFNFAMMNVTAILLHCLLPPLESIYADQYPILWFLDCYFTGVSSTLIAGGALGFLHILKWTSRTWILTANGLGIASGFFFQLTRIDSSIRTLSLELWYLIPTVFAGCLLLPSLYFGKRTDRGLIIILLYVGCSLCLIGALFVDAKLCRLTHGMLLDTLTASSLVFTACNVAFLLLGLSLDTQCAGKKKMR
jgi:hypothetical protein